MALEQISRILEEMATPNDQIRNPIQGIVGYASLNGDARSEKIIDVCLRVNKIVEKLDKEYHESKKVRCYFEHHECISQPSIREKKVVRPR
ncbi:MAG: hypothetical protein MUC66_04835 [Methanolinea sp.]|nr:hypothetical protein [Methanolinea sp.]